MYIQSQDSVATLICRLFHGGRQTREPGDYRLQNRDPDGCDPESCDYFVGIDTNEGNDSFLDFYLTADIDGWVAIGFSMSNNMVREWECVYGLHN